MTLIFGGNLHYEIENGMKKGWSPNLASLSWFSCRWQSFGQKWNPSFHLLAKYLAPSDDWPFTTSSGSGCRRLFQSSIHESNSFYTRLFYYYLPQLVRPSCIYGKCISNYFVTSTEILEILISSQSKQAYWMTCISYFNAVDGRKQTTSVFKGSK